MKNFEKCMMSCRDNKIASILLEEFSKLEDKRRECIRQDCKIYRFHLPSNIKYTSPIGFGLNKNDIANNILTLVTRDYTNADISIKWIGGEKLVEAKNKNIKKETQTVQNLLNNTRCQYCDIVNNFELYGPDICKNNNIKYLFTNMGRIMGNPVITILSSNGDVGRINGEIIKNGIYKDCFDEKGRGDLSEISKILEKEFKNNDYDVIINVFNGINSITK